MPVHRTPFVTWWAEVNGLLDNADSPPATLGEIRDLHASGLSPGGAAEVVLGERDKNPAPCHHRWTIRDAGKVICLGCGVEWADTLAR